jgi:hypothetical protein
MEFNFNKTINADQQRKYSFYYTPDLLTKTNLPKIRITYSKNNVTNEGLELIKNKSERDMQTFAINDNNNIQFQIYNKSIHSFKSIYDNYISNINPIQFKSFNLYPNLTSYTSKYLSIMIIYKQQFFSNNNELSTLLMLTPSNDFPNNFKIIHFSTINNDNINKEFQFALKFFSEHFPFYKCLYINIYYYLQNQKLFWNKDIAFIMKTNNFKWVKVENNEKGERFQLFKLINEDYFCDESNLPNTRNNNYMSLQMYLILNCDNGLNEKMFANNNKLLEDVMKCFYNNNTEYINQVKLILNDKYMKYKHDSNTEMLKFIKNNKIFPKLKFKNDCQYCCLYLQLESNFKLTTKVMINNNYYLSIIAHVKELYDKKTNQLFYMLFSENNFHYLICEMNDEFQKEIYENNGQNIYEKFKRVNKRIEANKSEVVVKTVLVPWINNVGNLNEKDKNEVEYGCSFGMRTVNKVININSVYMTPFNEYEICIKKDWFIAIINDKILDICDVDCLYCNIIKV